MSRNREMPSAFSKINARLVSPVNSILFSGVCMCILSYFIELEDLASVGSFCILLVHAITNLSALFMRRRSKIATFKAPFYPLPELLGTFLSLFLMMSLGINAIGIGFSVLVVGLALLQIYSLSGRKKRTRPANQE
jgi:APA family basic amino acid/polyamine antiporter